MQAYNFSTPTRQSAKGIFVVVFVNLAAQLKRSIPILVVFVLQWFRRPEKIQQFAWHIGFALGLLLLFLVIRSFLTYKNFLFYIEEDQFFLRQGILKKSKIVIPKANIQNIHISQNLLQQVLNVVQLNIDSAGDEGSEIQIKALTREQAQALRSQLLQSRVTENEPIAVLQDEPEEQSQLILALNPLDLLLIGFSQNHLRNLMLVVVAMIGFYQDIEEVLISFGAEVDDEALADLFNANVILASLILLFMGLLVGFLYSVFSVFIVNFSFSIKKTREALVIQKGLLNKNQFTVQLGKIQSVEYITNFLKGLFGLHTLKLYQTATAKKTEKKNALVGLRKSHLRQMEDLIFGSNPLNAVVKQKPHRYFLFRLIIGGLIVLGIANLYMLIIGSGVLFYANFLLVPTLGILIYLRWKKRYYYIDESYLVIGSGGIDTVTSIANLHNIQSVKFTETLFQKRRNLVDLHINTASNKFTIPCIDREETILIYDFILFKIESSFVNWNN